MLAKKESEFIDSNRQNKTIIIYKNALSRVDLLMLEETGYTVAQYSIDN